jgi:hypothetical protein
MTMYGSRGEDYAEYLAQRFRPERPRSLQGAGAFEKRWGGKARKRFHRHHLRMWLQRVSYRASSALNCFLVVGGIFAFWIAR